MRTPLRANLVGDGRKHHQHHHEGAHELQQHHLVQTMYFYLLTYIRLEREAVREVEVQITYIHTCMHNIYRYTYIIYKYLHNVYIYTT